MNKYNKIANELIKIIGEDNIISITHCATRLRVMVKDREIINDKKVEKVDEVKGVFFTSGQYQIILGTGIVNKVYAEVEKMGLKTLSKKEQDELVKNNETGFVVKEDVQELKKAIYNCYMDRDILIEFSKNCISNVKGFKWSTLANKTFTKNNGSK